MIQTIIALLLLLNTSFICAQDNSDTLRFGLYMRGKSKEMKQIDPSVVSDKNFNALFILGLEKPNITIYIDGKYARNSISNNNPEFFFFFANKENKQTLTISDLSGIIKNYPFTYALSPEDFILVRIFDMKRGRAIRLEKDKVFYGSRFKAFDQDKISYTIVPMEDNAYKVILDSALPKGEYGFIYNKPTPYDAIIYDFRIE